MADAAPILPQPSRAEIEAARVELQGRERPVGPRLVLLAGCYIPELSDRLPEGAAVAEGAPAAAPRVDDPLAALNEALQRLAAQYPELLTFDERLGMLRFASDFTFDSGSAQLKSGTSAAISQLAQILNSPEARPFEVKIVGHTDNQGKADYNLDLSRRRAANVVRELTARSAAAADRLDSFGCGWYAPVASNDSEDGRARNRRVELVKW